MEIIEAIKKRKSIRKFKPDPVPKEVIREILEIAGRAPSALNTQPWEFTVISGAVMENIKKGHIQKIKEGIPPNPELNLIEWPRDGRYRDRLVNLAMQLFKLMGIDRKNKKQRMEWVERGFRYFDAPAAIILSLDDALPGIAPGLDIGAIMQTICLAALHFNLGTCIENQGVMYPDVVRKWADIPKSRRLIVSIAIGFPDWDFPANKVESERESIESITNWYGFV
ncbi:MAG: nitroreductase [Deltaproteobacteria bacterium]|nr:nitroreductase [Deltaproteobacteria bacterium]